MKKPVTFSKREIPFIAALAVYILGGAAALLFLCFTRPEDAAPVFALTTQGKQADGLYDIRPELEGTPAPTQTPVSPSPAPSPTETPEAVHYYAFTTLNKVTGLHVRKTPGMDGEIITLLPPGTTGFVLERGEAWSKIQTPEVTGYSSNQYLDFEEVAKEDYLVW